MKIDRYLISGPPRTGGNLVQALLQSCRVPVVHTHDPLCTLDHYQTTALVILQRKDVFAAAMSNCIVWATGQDIDYPCKEVRPIYVSEKDFIAQVAVQVTYRNSHDFGRPYGAIYDFVFEDFVNDQRMILENLGLHQDQDLLHLKQLNNPAPYKYQQVVQNHERLKEIFDSLVLTDLTSPWIHSHGKEHANYN